MINYDELTKNSDELNLKIKKEKSIIEEFLTMQNNLKSLIDLYTSQISTTFANNEVFKNMLLASTEAALLQISINIKDLENLDNILDIILSNESVEAKDVEQYNMLFSKTEKNINFVNEIVQKTKDSFDQLSNVANAESISTVEKNNKKKSDEHKGRHSTAKVTRDIKQVSNDSSDLLCFFPKTDNDILAISTIQNTYQISFNDDVATICIEEENFYFTLKTVGVQISNSSNVLLISRKSSGFLVITNMVIEVPNFINVSKITRNKNFVEFEITNSTLNISVKDNELSFSESSVINSQTQTAQKDMPNDIQNDIQKNTQNDTQNDIKGDNPSVTNKDNNNLENSTTAENTSSDDSMNLLKDNDTLIISEKDNKVILPYKIKDVENLYQKNKKKYSSVQDLIKNEYIISAENFKNPIKSRFREAYQLIKKREHGHLKEAIDLGFELMFQSNLNPAIIAACKNLKELDIYLDCLDDNELDKFSCFNIVYNVPPSSKK